LIAIDTSALLAIALAEPAATACETAIQLEDTILISAGTLVESLIVSGGRGVRAEVDRLVHALGLVVVGVDHAQAMAAVAAQSRWGRGVHPAALNFGDCFSYALATTYDCPLLYVGNDFSRTDVRSVI
jgi:ribonuclease VapC